MTRKELGTAALQAIVDDLRPIYWPRDDETPQPEDLIRAQLLVHLAIYFGNDASLRAAREYRNSLGG